MANNLLDLTDLTPQQQEFINKLQEGDFHTIVWIGATGSGKTAGICTGLVQWAMYNYAMGVGNGKYIIGGPSIGQVEQNSLDYFEDIAGQLGLSFSQARGRATEYTLGNIIKFRLVGGDNKRSWRRAMGYSSTGAWIDEATHCDPDFIDAVTTRGRYAEHITILSANAESPYNPVKQKYIDNKPDGVYVMESDFYSNQHYPDKMRENIKNSGLAQHNLKRLTENVWMPAEGLVFPIESWMVVHKEFQPYGIVAVDEGISGTTAGLLFVPTGYNENGEETWHIADEYIHKAEWGIQTAEFHIRQMKAKWGIELMLCDPSGSAMKAAAMHEGVPVTDADNSIEQGIQSVLNALHQQRLTIEPTCTYLLVECSAYSYNEVTDKPHKTKDHAADCMRYGSSRLLPNHTAVLYGSR